MDILNIAGYRFTTTLHELAALQQSLLAECSRLALKGTIILSHEGVNINLAGEVQSIHSFIAYLKSDTRFDAMKFHQTYSDTIPFKLLKVKLKKQIITLRQEKLSPSCDIEVQRLSPKCLKQWLDEKRNILLLDTRNDYEISLGTFTGALNLQLKNFGELPKVMTFLDKNLPIVMFCTGGIRCEKGGLYLQNQGFSNIYQLDGGILGYFSEVGRAHYEGECFVFDERISVNADCFTFKSH